MILIINDLVLHEEVFLVFWEKKIILGFRLGQGHVLGDLIRRSEDIIKPVGIREVLFINKQIARLLGLLKMVRILEEQLLWLRDRDFEPADCHVEASSKIDKEAFFGHDDLAVPPALKSLKITFKALTCQRGVFNQNYLSCCKANSRKKAEDHLNYWSCIIELID